MPSLGSVFLTVSAVKSARGSQKSLQAKGAGATPEMMSVPPGSCLCPPATLLGEEEEGTHGTPRPWGSRKAGETGESLVEGAVLCTGVLQNLFPEPTLSRASKQKCFPLQACENKRLLKNFCS